MMPLKERCMLLLSMHMAPCATDPIVLCLMQLGGSGVLVQPMTYIFDEEPARWRTIVKELELPESVTASIG